MNLVFKILASAAAALILWFGANPIEAADPAQAGSPPPNILILMGDDATYSDFPLYGGTNLKTPNIDRLAEQGLTFNRAYLASAMCQPCRAELYTGHYPARNGCCWNHSAVRPGTRSIPHYLDEMGYRVGIAGKIHVEPRKSFPFERVPGVTGGALAKDPQLDPRGINAFMNRDPEQPFCLVVAMVNPHVPWTAGNAEAFDPDHLELPPYLVDTPQTRRDYARYLAEIKLLDRQTGRVLDALEESGQADRTLVMFTSEQGAQIPGCKWTNWEQGVHTVLVVRWPGQVTPDTRTDALVQYADVLPTLLEAAGAEVPSGQFDGTSFLPVLLGQKPDHRRYVYFMHNNVPEGPPYPIRSIRDETFHYIRNLTPGRTYIEKHMMGRPDHNPYFPTWMYATAEDPHAYRVIQRYMHRPEEELYRPGRDPNELENLADAPAYAQIKKRLSAELDRWMQDQGDPGKSLDSWEQLKAARKGRHFFP